MALRYEEYRRGARSDNPNYLPRLLAGGDVPGAYALSGHQPPVALIGPNQQRGCTKESCQCAFQGVTIDQKCMQSRLSLARSSTVGSPAGNFPSQKSSPFAPIADQKFWLMQKIGQPFVRGLRSSPTRSQQARTTHRHPHLASAVGGRCGKESLLPGPRSRSAAGSQASRLCGTTNVKG